MTAADRNNRVALQLAELIREYQERPPRDLSAALRELTDSAARFVPGAQSAGITVATPDGKIETVSSTHPTAELMDDLQRRYQEGPCLAAAWDSNVMRIDDMSAETRWPQFCDGALRESDVRSVLAYQLFAERSRRGALNFYADRADAFDDASAEMSLVVATHTALAWNALDQTRQFRSALASRDVIGQAKGIVMERYRIDAVSAFDLLKRLSQESNSPVADVAEQIVRTSASD
jgi:hypothetical protein